MDKLPSCFEGGLQFGNPAQIAFVQSQRQEAENEEYMEEQGKKLYRVHVRVDGSYFQDVWADSEADAIAEFKDEFDIDYVDLDIDFEGEEL